ncbi:MAG: hypothetical protein JST54_01355 [Deltaproteobacteria bacterium]|nr:hypothetical protein [Deltaproteobacteria bacterium]
MKKLLVLGATLLAVGCGKNNGNTSSGGSSASSGNTSGGNWGCQTTGPSCVCQLNPQPGQFTDTTCPGSGTGCSYTTTQGGQTECISNSSIPAASCAQVASAAQGTVVASCPPPGSTSGTNSSAGTTNGTNSTAGTTNGTNSTAGTTNGTNSTAGTTNGTNSTAGTTNGTNSTAGNTTGTNSSAGTTGSTGGTWGCDNSSSPCTCVLNGDPGQYPDASCNGSSSGVGCAYEVDLPGQSECVFNPNADATQCADAAAAVGGTVVDACPPSGSTTGTNSSAGTTTGTNSSATTTTGTNSSAGTTTGTNSSAGTTTGTNSSAGTTTGTNSSATTTTGTNSSAGTTTGTNSSAGTTTGTNSSATTTTGTNSSAGTTTGTNSSAGTTTGSSAGTTGTGGPGGLGSGAGSLSGTQPFTVAGAFEATGTDSQTGRPTLKFMMFDAPMTCSMFQSHTFPPYYGYLGDGRIVFAYNSSAHDVYLPNNQDVPYYYPDGGAFYTDVFGTTQVYKPISLKNFPSTTNIVEGNITSASSSAVGTGSYTVSGSTNTLGKGTLSLSGGSPHITSIAQNGTINYTSYNVSVLDGNFNVNLISAPATGTGWGCQTSNNTCICNSSASCGAYPDSSCSITACCYTSPGANGTTSCTCLSQSSGCSTIVGNTQGATQVSSCPAPGSPARSCSGGGGPSGPLSGSFAAVQCSGF